MANIITIKRKALFGDCDPAGIVYTPRFSYFVLEAVHEALRLWLNGLDLKALLADDLILPVRALKLDFTHPVAWDDEMTITVQLSKLGERSFSFVIHGYVLDNQPAFSADLTKVTVSAASRKSIVIPADIKQLLAKAL